MKLGLFLVSLLSLQITLADEIDDFLEDFDKSKEAINIDLEERTGAEFQVIDKLTKEEQDYQKAIFNPPRFKKRKVIISSEPYIAQLKANSILRKINSKEVFRVKRPIVVKALEKMMGSQFVTILNKEGKGIYTTETSNAINIENEVALHPEFNPKKVYMNKTNYNLVDTETRFRHFFSYHFESMRSNYFPTIYRGTTQTSQGNTLESKNYLISNRFPIQFGFNLNYNFGYWEDPSVGTVTWQGLFIGPSIMGTFWKKEGTRWNAHFNGFKSVFHQSQKDPDIHKFSTLGIQFELEKEIDLSTGSYTLGINSRWSRSSVKEATEYLQNEALKGQVISFGVYLSYKFDWVVK